MRMKSSVCVCRCLGDGIISVHGQRNEIIQWINGNWNPMDDSRMLNGRRGAFELLSCLSKYVVRSISSLGSAGTKRHFGDDSSGVDWANVLKKSNNRWITQSWGFCLLELIFGGRYQCLFNDQSRGTTLISFGLNGCCWRFVEGMLMQMARGQVSWFNQIKISRVENSKNWNS